MSVTTDQLRQFEGICDKAVVHCDGAVEYIHLSNLRIRVNGSNYIVDAILCPSVHTGYTTRLFLSQPFPQKAANWSVHQILGHAWHTWSWQGVPADLEPVQMVLCHLDALK